LIETVSIYDGADGDRRNKNKERRERRD